MCQYDVLLKEFPNGDVELRVYDKYIHELDNSEKLNRARKRAETILNRQEDLKNSFDDSSLYYEFLEDYAFALAEKDGFQKLLTFDEFYEMEERKRQLKNIRDSRRRTVNAINDIARCERWEFFVTLTFDKQYGDRSDFKLCMSRACKWLNNQKVYSKDLKYLIVPELHADGVNWHVHGLLCNIDGLKYTDSGKRDNNGRVIYNLDGWHFGWSTATFIDDTSKASSYVLKYITKELCANSLNQRRYFHSNNIQKPMETRIDSQFDLGLDLGQVQSVDSLDSILDSIGAEVSRVKRVSTEHCSVTYINAHIKESEEEKNE